jgi:glycosyltransferase involved in cell wall biosynthesis
MKFSVLLPTRNRLQYLRQAVETVLRQDYADWEIVVSDNDSEEDIAGYVRSLADPRIRYCRTERFVPVTENWNNALEKSTGDYVVMLGDDDGLMPGYFSTVRRLIDEFARPDVIYTAAFIFAYPGVLPGAPDGSLAWHAHAFAERGGEPFWLERGEAVELVRQSMNFRLFFGFNAQFFVVSRRMVEELSRDGPFYRSPFPDYYSSNLLLLEAERILVYPRPMVVIGITPKSYGFFHFNRQEAEGIAFLNGLPDREAAERLRSTVLPGTNINNGWLFAMEALRSSLPRGLGLKVSYRRYRWLQIIHVYEAVRLEKRMDEGELRALRRRLRPRERLFLGAGEALDAVLNRVVFRLEHPRVTRRLLAWRKKRLDQFPDWPSPRVDGRFRDLIDVFERVDAPALPARSPGHVTPRPPGRRR